MPSQTPSADDTETVMNDRAGHRPTDSTSGSSWARKPWSDATLVGLLLLVTLSCYANTLTNGFVYDDLPQILQNPYVKSWRFLPEIFGTTVWSFVGQAGTTNYYRPLMTFSFLVLWKIFGPVAFGFHLFSVVMHAAVVTMVFYAGARVFRERSVARVAALLFAVHPIHTEAVSWTAALPVLEAAFFLLLAVWLLAEEGRMDWKKHALVMASFVLALLSKEPSLMLVPLAITFEHGVSYGRQTTSLSDKIARYAPVSLVGVSYLFLRIVLFGKVAPVLQHPQITWPQTIYSGFALVLNYAKLLVWPNRLSAFHVFHARTSLFDPQVLGGVAVVLLGILGIFALRKAPAAAFALLWIVGTLAPVLNARWMASNGLTERYLYLPSIGFCWLLAWCGVRLWESKRILALSPSARRVVLGLLLVATIVLAAVRVITRNRDWQSDFALYTRTLQTDPDAHIIRSNLAGAYFELHDYARAGREWEAALAGKPDNVVRLNSPGSL